MNSYYLLLPTLEIANCNWESSHLTRSLPLTAIAGFVDRLIYFELHEHPEVQLTGFAVCFHGGQIYAGLSKNPLALCKGDGGKQAEKDLLNPPIIPEVKGQMTLSLIVALKATDTLDEWLNTRAISFLHTCRLAGGEIIRTGKPRICSDRRGLSKALRRLPVGWFIKNRADLIEPDPDPFSALIKAVARFPVEDKSSQNGQSTRKRLYPGWLYVTCVGYQLLESPQPRLNRSHSTEYPVKHAYAEPAHSLAELIWSRGVQILEEDWLTSQHLLWRWCSDKTSSTTYLSTHCKEF